MDCNTEKTHAVCEGQEVILTGRKAIKPVGTTSKVLELYEIEPADGTGIWKKWVKKDQLFEII